MHHNSLIASWCRDIASTRSLIMHVVGLCRYLYLQPNVSADDWREFVAHMNGCTIDSSRLIDFICADSGNPHVVIGVDDMLKSSNTEKTRVELKHLIGCSLGKRRMVWVIATTLSPPTVEPMIKGQKALPLGFIPLPPLSVKLESYPELIKLIENRARQSQQQTINVADANCEVAKALLLTGGHPRSIQQLHDIVSDDASVLEFEWLVCAVFARSLTLNFIVHAR